MCLFKNLKKYDSIWRLPDFFGGFPTLKRYGRKRKDIFENWRKASKKNLVKKMGKTLRISRDCGEANARTSQKIGSIGTKFLLTSLIVLVGIIYRFVKKCRRSTVNYINKGTK